jgi:hypothetical protein
MRSNPNPYDIAAASFKKAAEGAQPMGNDADVWHLNNGLWHLAQALRQDMDELKKRLVAAEDALSATKRRTPPHS